MGSENKLKVIIGADDQTKAAFKSATANAAKFAAGMTAALGGAALAAAKFETGLAEIQTLLGKGAAPAVAQMRKELLGLSKQSGETLGALTRARYDIISAGFTGAADSANVLNASLVVAKGGLVDAAVAADLMTTALNGMKIPASRASEVADDLFTIVKLGKTTMGELAASMGQVFATANIAGISMEEVGAAMATITASGIDTAEASTALTQLLTAIAAPSGEAKAALDELGISLKNGLGPALEALAGASEAGLDQLKLLIPNIRAIKAAATAGADMDKFNAALAEFEVNAGVASEAASIMSATFVEHFKRLRQTVIVFAESVGVELLPGLKSMVDSASKGVDAFSKLPEPIKKAGVAAAVAATGITALAAAFGMLAININGALIGLGKLKSFGAVAGLAKAAGAAAGAIGGVGGAAALGVAGGLAVGVGGLAFGGSPNSQRLSGSLASNLSGGAGGRIPLPGPRPGAIPANLLAHFGASPAAAAVAGSPVAAGAASFGGITEGMSLPTLPGADLSVDLSSLQQVRGEFELVSVAVERIKSDFALFAESFAAGAITDTVYAFSDSIALAVVAGEDFGKTFSDIFKQIKVQLVSAIVQFVVLKVVIKSLLSAMGIGGIGSLLGFATGGGVPGPRLAAAGFASVPGGGGLDNVPVLLRGGETVLSPERSDMMRRALFQPTQGNSSLIGRWQQRNQGGGGMLVGVKDSFTASEAVDFEDVLERATDRSEGLR